MTKGTKVRLRKEERVNTTTGSHYIGDEYFILKPGLEGVLIDDSLSFSGTLVKVRWNILPTLDHMSIVEKAKIEEIPEC